MRLLLCGRCPPACCAPLRCFSRFPRRRTGFILLFWSYRTRCCSTNARPRMQHYVILQNEPRGLPLNFKLLPEWLNSMGYTSYMVGKWHLGFYKAAYTPTRRGFSSHVGSWGGFVDYYTHDRSEKGMPFGLDFRRGMSVSRSDDGAYYTDIVSQEAESIIRTHDKNKPMFLYVAHLAPHFATEREHLQVPEHYLEGYESIGHSNRTLYAGMVSALDESVGAVFRALHERGMLEDSLVVFASDNGAASSARDLDASSSWPLKGEKETLWEGGVRVPGIVWSPQLNRGSVYDRFFHFTDWLPTLYEVAGGDAAKLGDIDGVSHAESLADHKATPPRTELLLNIDSVEGLEAIIQGHYKLVSGTVYGGSSDRWFSVSGDVGPDAAMRAMDACRGSAVAQVLTSRGGPEPLCGDRTEDYVYSKPLVCGVRDASPESTCNSVLAPCLFDIVEDPCEYNNLASDKPQVVDRLLSRLEHYRSGSVPPGNVEVEAQASPDLHDGVWVPWGDEDYYRRLSADM
ncbi:arylsulfatase B-like isoform X2 [Haemaphysalis longicornis]